MSIRGLALSVLLAGLAPVVEASELQQLRPVGHWRTDYFQSSKALDDERGFLGSTLQLKVLPRITESVDGKVEVRITHSALGESGDTRAVLLEGYSTLHFSKADLRIGKQIVAWGRADGINPTDNLTPRDYTVMLPFEDDQRTGTPSMRLDVFMSREQTVTLFATPFFEPSRVPLPAPARSVSRTQAGLKLDHAGEGFDWSVSVFRGNSLLPQLAQQLRYDRITVFGADFARNYGRFGFRGEVSYVDTADDHGTDAAVKNPYLYWIAGVDRTLFDNLNVNLQFIQRRVRHFRGPERFADPVARSTLVRNAIFNGQRNPVSNGLSFRISHQWIHETLEAEIFAAHHFNPSNTFIRPLLTYSFDDHWKGTVGAEIYLGQADTSYGSLEANRGGFAELRYGF